MQMQSSGNKVVHTLTGRLNIGGKWYGRGDPVLLDTTDAEVYAMRGLSSPSPAGAIPKNVEALPASQVGLVTKVEMDAEDVEVEPPAEMPKPAQFKGGAQHGRRNR